jgi:hypothetical protein
VNKSKVMMDQLAFDQLYRSQLPGIQQHVAILRPDALNSQFPSWRHQREASQVLHLAATSALMRRRTFQRGLSVVCSHLQPQRAEKTDGGDETIDTQEGTSPLGVKNTATADHPLLPRQLGLSRSQLMNLRNDLPVEDTILDTSVSIQQRLARLDEARNEGAVDAEDTASGAETDILQARLPTKSFIIFCLSFTYIYIAYFWLFRKLYFSFWRQLRTPSDTASGWAVTQRCTSNSCKP